MQVCGLKRGLGMGGVGVIWVWVIAGWSEECMFGALMCVGVYGDDGRKAWVVRKWSCAWK